MITSVVYTLSELLPEGEPPVEIRLFKSGINQTTKGKVLFDEEAASIVMAEYAVSPTRELMFDFGHASLKPKCPEDNEAAGWFVPELRNGELWATAIKWVDEVADKIRARKYRFYSPAFTPGEAGRPLRLVNCALTNLPATIGLEPLMASELENNSNMLPKLAEMLGLDPATCTEADVMSALETMQKEMADLKAKAEAPMSTREPMMAVDPMKCSEVEEVIMLSGVSDWKTAIVTLSTEVKTLRVEKQTAKVAETVENAIKARKLTPAQRDSFVKLGMKDLEMLSEIIANTSVVIPEPSNQPENKNILALSDIERKTCQQLGITEEAYAAQNAVKD